MDISIHALLAESDRKSQRSGAGIGISIHALLAESDHYGFLWPARVRKFLSTLSLRRATYTDLNSAYGALISIHALLAESDGRIPANIMLHFDFYPRSPCGERQLTVRQSGLLLDFYPRSPCGERHLTGGLNCDDRNFYPRSPCGERQHAYQLVLWVLRFLSTLSLRRAT